MNTDELEAALYEASHRVLEIQTKLHRWATDDPGRRFVDLFNLSPIPRSCWLRGIGCGPTGAPEPPEWTG